MMLDMDLWQMLGKYITARCSLSEYLMMLDMDLWQMLGEVYDSQVFVK